MVLKPTASGGLGEGKELIAMNFILTTIGNAADHMQALDLEQLENNSNNSTANRYEGTLAFA